MFSHIVYFLKLFYSEKNQIVQFRKRSTFSPEVDVDISSIFLRSGIIFLVSCISFVCFASSYFRWQVTF